MKTIAMLELKNHLGKLGKDEIILDVREDDEWRAGHAAGAVHLGKGVLERDIEPRDDYGRLLGYLHRASDGLFVNLELAERGYAVPLAIDHLANDGAKERVKGGEAKERADDDHRSDGECRQRRCREVGHLACLQGLDLA